MQDSQTPRRSLQQQDSQLCNQLRIADTTGALHVLQSLQVNGRLCHILLLSQDNVDRQDCVVTAVAYCRDIIPAKLQHMHNTGHEGAAHVAACIRWQPGQIVALGLDLHKAYITAQEMSSSATKCALQDKRSVQVCFQGAGLKASENFIAEHCTWGTADTYYSEVG